MNALARRYGHVVRRLGVMQRRVLECVRDHGTLSPPGSDYETHWKYATPGWKLVQRGWIGLRSHLHPDVVVGRVKQMYLTEAGKAALTQ